MKFRGNKGAWNKQLVYLLGNTLRATTVTHHAMRSVPCNFVVVVATKLSSSIARGVTHDGVERKLYAHFVLGLITSMTIQWGDATLAFNFWTTSSKTVRGYQFINMRLLLI